MNALVSIDRILSPETITRPVDVLTPAIVFAPGGVESIISKLEAEVRATDRDMTTDQGREAIKSLAYKIARSKTALDEMGKELVAGIKKQSGVIDAERRTIRDRLDALRDDVRGPLTAWEDAETARVDGHERAIVFLVGSPRNFPTPPTVAEIRARILEVSDVCSRQWQEFNERAEAAATDAILSLDAMLVTAIQREADAAELAELRALKAEREAADIAAELDAQAAERERIAAEQQAAAEAATAQRERAAALIRANEATRQAEAAAAKAVEDERQRVAKVAADEKAAADKLAANKKHRAKIYKEIGESLVAHLFHDTPDEEGDELVATIVGHIASGRIPHVSITY